MQENNPISKVAIYCGASNNVDPRYYKIAAEVGATLANQGIGVVFGGGQVGLMGALADGALNAGGEIVGVITEKLQHLELGHNGLTELHVVETMSERKAMMLKLADAFVALPGGVGTWEEIFEAATLTQLNYQLKPTGFLNALGYYQHLIQFLDHASAEGFLRPNHKELFIFEENFSALLERLRHCELPSLDT